MTLARRRATAAGLAASALLAFACTKERPPAESPPAATPSAASVTRAPFGTAPDGTPVDVYTLVNSHGIRTRILTYGGIVQTLETPDRTGKLDDVVLGFDDLQGYV